MSSYTEHDNRGERWLRRGGYLLGLLSLFGGLLYFVGRRYAEQYFVIMGVPSQELSLDFSTFVYYGANPIQLIIVIMFTILGVAIFRLITYQKPPEVQTPRKRWKGFTNFLNSIKDGLLSPRTFDNWREDSFFAYTLILFFICSFGLPIIALIEIFGTPSTYSDVRGLEFAIFMFLAFCCIWVICSLFYEDTLLKICRHKRIKSWVLWGSLIALVLLPYLGAGAYASFKGYTDISLRHVDRIFDTVSLEASVPINAKLGWEKVDKQDNSYYQTTKTMYLVYASKENLYIKLDSDVEETIVIPKANLDSYVVKKQLFLTATPAPTIDNATNKH
jgi:hypothetical protein